MVLRHFWRCSLKSVLAAALAGMLAAPARAAEFTLRIVDSETDEPKPRGERSSLEKLHIVQADAVGHAASNRQLEVNVVNPTTVTYRDHRRWRVCRDL